MFSGLKAGENWRKEKLKGRRVATGVSGAFSSN
jgi:hypothetical protein